MSTEEAIRSRYEQVAPFLNERQRRLFAGAEARVAGPRSTAMVARATGLSVHTVKAGITDLSEGNALDPERVRRPGGGRKKLDESDPDLWSDLERLVEPTTRGDPESPLRWTTKSTRRLADELRQIGHRVSHEAVASLLRGHGYSLQANRKTLEGTSHPDRDAQFIYINDQLTKALKAGQPAISVDAKKKELVGPFKNGGTEWQPKGEPEKVRVHDFIDPALGKANPYGVYDIGNNDGWVSVGNDHDTAVFAVATIERWWHEMGELTYPGANSLLITADCGGSNGVRLRLWKTELQRLSDATGLEVTVCHLPPGTSKWNKIEHRMFSYISKNWRGRPLTSMETIVNLIGSTTTKTGLSIRAGLDSNVYPTGVKPSTEELTAMTIRPHAFHGDWNYTFTRRDATVSNV
jgi:transposase